MLDEKLWARAPTLSAKFASEALVRFKADQEKLRSTLLYQRMKRSWQNYNARGEGGICDDTQLNFAGERGEIVKLNTRRYRRLIQDQVGLVQQTPPDYQPEAINTDPESQAQCSLALGLLDQYKRRNRLEDIHIERAEIALVMSSSFLHVRWDPDAGDVARVEDGPMPAPVEGAPVAPDATSTVKPPAPPMKEVFEGDLVFSVRTRLECAYDHTSTDRRSPRWHIVHEPMNRYDLIAMFGNEKREDAEELLRALEGAPKWSAFMQEWGFEQAEDEFDESIGVYWVYYDKCKALPEGRKALVLNDKFTLLDGPLDEDRIGVFRLSPSDVILSAEGHTNNFDGLAVMQAISAQGSMIQSNHDNMGLLRILASRRANIDTHKLATGFAAVDYDDKDAQNEAVAEPHVLDMFRSQPELIEWFQLLQSEADTIMGGSPVTRGDPEATKGDSGSKAAMLFAAAQNVGSGFVRAKLRSDEEVATFMIGSIRRHASEERITSIVGKNSTYTAKRFKGEDLKNISRINVRQANPARDTFQGRMAMAELLADKTPEQQQQIIALVNTGRTETITEDTETERLLIERENDALRDLKQPPPVTVDSEQHIQHMLKHMKCKNDPSIRNDPNLMQRYDAHIAEHIARLTPDDPKFAGVQVLMVTNQKPLPSHAEVEQMLMAAKMGASVGGGAPVDAQGNKASSGGPPDAGASPSKRPTGEGGARMPTLPRAADTGQQPNLDTPAPNGVSA